MPKPILLLTAGMGAVMGAGPGWSRAVRLSSARPSHNWWVTEHQSREMGGLLPHSMQHPAWLGLAPWSLSSPCPPSPQPLRAPPCHGSREQALGAGRCFMVPSNVLREVGIYISNTC